MTGLHESAFCNMSTQHAESLVSAIEKIYMLDRPITIDGERRQHQRMNVTMPVVITPLDNQLQTLDYKYHAVSRDICRSGIGLVTTNPISPGNVLLTLEPCRGGLQNVIARITYCNEFGYYFQVGCEFVTS